jgi:hypothetical protein
MNTAVTHADCADVVLRAGHVGHDRLSVGHKGTESMTSSEREQSLARRPTARGVLVAICHPLFMSSTLNPINSSLIATA